MDLQTLLGSTVHVIVDRPIGHIHKGMVYPVNYGYIPGMIAGDGEDQDAYILGISEPLQEFHGRVIGIIHRKNDIEDKLVVAPEGMRFHQGQIAQAVHFQEQYFDYTVDSIFHLSCGVIPYRKTNENTEFLLLFQAGSQTWSFPKGHMEADETTLQTALRELTEETGLTASIQETQQVVVEYNLSSVVSKQVILFLGEVSGEPIIQPQEILAYRWVTAQQLASYLQPNTYSACMKLISTI